MEAIEHIDYSFINPRCSCFNLRRASRAMTQYFDHMLEPAGIRATQFTLLVSMATLHTSTLTELADSLVMDRTTLTRNLKPLEKMNFIVTLQPRDKRSKAYVLNENGRAVLAKAIPLWQRAQEKIQQELGQERYNLLLRELDAITKIVVDK